MTTVKTIVAGRERIAGPTGLPAATTPLPSSGGAVHPSGIKNAALPSD